MKTLWIIFLTVVGVVAVSCGLLAALLLLALGVGPAWVIGYLANKISDDKGN